MILAISQLISLCIMLISRCRWLVNYSLLIMFLPVGERQFCMRFRLTASVWASRPVLWKQKLCGTLIGSIVLARLASYAGQLQELFDAQAKLRPIIPTIHLPNGIHSMIVVICLITSSPSCSSWMAPWLHKLVVFWPNSVWLLCVLIWMNSEENWNCKPCLMSISP